MIEHVFWQAIGAFNWIVLGYFTLLNLTYLATTIAAFRVIRRYTERLKSVQAVELLSATGSPPITIVGAAFNEQATVIEAVRSLLNLEYPSYRICIVNDGSKDDTLGVMRRQYAMEPVDMFPTGRIPTGAVRGVYRSTTHPNLIIIDKENGGAADARNVGFNYARTPLICVIDADSLLERDALLRIARPFLEDSDTIAAGGIIRVINGCTVDSGFVRDIRLPRNLLARFQVLEYLRAFLSARVGWDALEANFLVSGAFGVFRRDLLIEANGYDRTTIGEDMELTLRMQRTQLDREARHRVEFIPDPVCWTEVPETIRQLGRQRDRWHRGLLQVFDRHRDMVGNPRYGRLGMIAMPYLFFLELYGPIIEALGYIAFIVTVILGGASGPYVFAFLGLAFAFGMALSVSAIALEEMIFRRYARLTDLLRLFALGLIEAFGYRQLNSWWRIRGTISYFRGVNTWGNMERKGFAKPTA
jgi:cellulose synthase/poly-beta-1,6-N-acetylglucosamine synthase-like glycosyltransferase